MPGWRASHSSSWPESGRKLALFSKWSGCSTKPPGNGKVFSTANSVFIAQLADTSRPLRFCYRSIALKPFKRKLDRGDSHCVRAGIEVGQRLVFRNPTSVKIVGESFLANFVENINSNVLAKLTQAGEAVAGKIVYQVSPVFEGRVIGYARLQRNVGIRALSGQFAGD